MSKRRKRIAIAGCVGIPAKYGGFETLAENLVLYSKDHSTEIDIIVYCSGKSYPERLEKFAGARLVYIPLQANGITSIFYDMWSLIDAAARGVDEVLLLGHGGSFVLPLVKAFSSVRVLTNIDGIEWRREKWSMLARFILRRSERFAVRYSDIVIADNEAIREYVAQEFAKDCVVIPYGGDQALYAEPDADLNSHLPTRYALSLCRIEPENNVEMILRAFSKLDHPLVFVGNWDASDYGRRLKAEYGDHPSVVIHDPIYEPRRLRAIRDAADFYIHGHSAGGTNPALVEMMHFDIPVLAHGCNFNRFTTEEKAHYFMSEADLIGLVNDLTPKEKLQNAEDTTEIARRRYTWDRVGEAYLSLLQNSQ
ncbi:MAG: DUF1972 domain-containing protein [Pseudomonadota bacterium]